MVSIIASGIGIFVSALFLLFTAVPLSELALSFGPGEYFALAFVGLSLVVGLAEGLVVKGAVAMGIGLALATVGLDTQTGVPRFAVSTELFEGLPLVPVLLASMRCPKCCSWWRKARRQGQEPACRRVHVMELKGFWPLNGVIMRSSVLGYVIGIIRCGRLDCILHRYAMAKRTSKNPELFGKGSVEGVAASEAQTTLPYPARWRHFLHRHSGIANDSGHDRSVDDPGHSTRPIAVQPQPGNSLYHFRVPLDRRPHHGVHRPRRCTRLGTGGQHSTTGDCRHCLGDLPCGRLFIRRARYSPYT